MQLARGDLAQARADAVKEAIAKLDGQMEEARKRSELMENEIADQLQECGYNAVMRDVIEDAAKLLISAGLVGPEIDAKTKALADAALEKWVRS